MKAENRTKLPAALLGMSKAQKVNLLKSIAAGKATIKDYLAPGDDMGFVVMLQAENEADNLYISDYIYSHAEFQEAEKKARGTIQMMVIRLSDKLNKNLLQGVPRYCDRFKTINQ